MRLLLLAALFGALVSCTAPTSASGDVAGESSADLPTDAPDAPDAPDTSASDASVDPGAPDPVPDAIGRPPEVTEPSADASIEAGVEAAEAHVPDALPDDPGPPVPPSIVLTVDAIPAGMNGSVPFLSNDLVETPFHLAVPRQGFTLDVTVAPGSAPVDPSTLVVTADVPVGEAPAGTDLGPRFTWTDATHATWRVAADFPEAWPVTVTTRVAATDGQAAPEAALSFEVRELTPSLDPFEQPDLWLLDFERDAWSITVTEGPDAFEVTSTPGANGVGDFDEMLTALGFLGADPAFDAAFLQHFRAELRANLHAMFLLAPDGAFTDDSVRVRLVFSGDPDAPDPASFAPDGGFSMMAIGGDSLTVDGTPTGYLGMSWLDWNNEGPDDDASDPAHGVFFTALMRKTASFAALKPLLSLIVPATGTPLGGLPDDAKLLDPAYSPPNDADPLHKKRATLVKLFFKVGGIGLAALTAHEMGHSLGLVAPGAPPAGLFGGACEASFVVTCSDDAHLDTAGANLMQSGKSLNVADFLTSYPRFEPLSLAYLQRRLVVGPVF